jgi:pectin lyase
VHAVNNYWYANSGHALEGEQGFALVEGSVFQNVDDPQDSKSTLSIFASTSSTSVCRNALGRNCEANIFGSSGPLSEGDTAVLSKLAGKGAAGATIATSAQKSVPASAGYGKI